MTECCNHGVCEVKSQIVGNEHAQNVLLGLTNKAVRELRAKPDMGVRELTTSISEGDVTLQDVMDIDLAPDPIAYYMPDRDEDMVPGTDLPFSRLALAVATCVTRAVDGTCEELHPIKLETITTRS